MLPKPNVSRNLLEQYLNEMNSQDKQAELLREHPELHPYHQVVIPMFQALYLVMNVVGRQLIDANDIDSIEDLLRPEISKVILKWMIWDDTRLADHPQMPHEVMKNLLLKAEDREEAIDIFLTIHAGLEYPDYLTEESYWLVRSVDAGLYQKFLARCEYALRFCLLNGINKQFVLNMLENLGK